MELANLERQQGQLLERYLDQHPDVVKVRKQIQDTHAKIRAEGQRVISAAENDYKAAAAQEASVAAALEAAKAEALDLSRRAVQYDSLKRELEGNKEILNSLLARHKETDIAQELKASNIRIVDMAAVPQTPIRPNKTRDILMGLLLGAALSTGLAYLLESVDNTLKSPDDVRSHLRMPLLGVIPEVPGSGDVIVLEARAQGPFLEGYRALRTALAYSWPDQAPRVLVVASTAPGEGKTLVSVNLALTLASGGGKVLLVDADLRKPRAHTLLKGRKSPGLSDVLVGKASPSESIQRCGGTTLGLLASGTGVPSPADLMSNQTMRGLLDQLRGLYDWIVIDTPPVGAVAEALILAPLSDGAVVVAGAEMVPRRAIMDSLQRLHETGARILGIVLNRTHIERYSSYYYGRSYSQSPQRQDTGKVARIHDQRARR
jgi:polysaccharide biosynthesis transport protein